MEAQLSDRLAENACVVHVVPGAEVAATVCARAVAHAAGATVAIAPDDPVLAHFDVLAALRAADVDLLLPTDDTWRAALPLASVGVTGAALAVVEPAAIALRSARGMPRATSLVPPVHLCVLRAEDIRATFADAITELAPGPLPSALTWIGGPSRTGDLEMVQTLGVHGPVAVEVVIARA